MGYLFNGVEDTGVPMKIIESIIEGFNVPFFIETGTASGHSIVEASKKFKFCHTIELIQDRETVEIENKNIEFHKGDSIQLIPKILKEIGNEYVVFWLDAHYSETVPADEDCIECPIIEEIEATKSNQKAIILIDDARFFLGATPYPMNPNKWASILEVFNCLQKNFPKHHITIIDDYVVAIPIEMKGNLNKYWLETFDIRYK